MYPYVVRPDAMSVLVRVVPGLVEFPLVPRAKFFTYDSESLAMHYAELCMSFPVALENVTRGRQRLFN